MVKVPKAANLDVGSQVTLDFWMKGDPSNNFTNCCQGLVATDFFVVETSGGGVGFAVSTDGASFPEATSGVISTNVWHHVAGTYDGSNLKLYVDGVLQSTTPHSGSIAPMLANSFLSIGSEDGRSVCPGCVGTRYFKGLIDEVEIFNRALTGTEVANIYNASFDGKCFGAQATSGMIGWWPADGDARDITGNGNNGTPNGTAFAVGKVGQAFNFSGTGSDQVTTPLILTSHATIDAWVNPSTLTGGFTDANLPGVTRRAAAGAAGNSNDLAIGLYGGKLGALYKPPEGVTAVLQSNIVVQTGQWYHVAVTIDGTTATLYVNGSNQASGTTAANYVPNPDFRIGAVSCCTGDAFGGLVDETTVYNRVLTVNEIQSVFNAGLAGKYKSTVTNTGSNVSSNEGGDATVTFPGVSTAGTTQQVPLDPATLPAEPLTPLGLTYDISTSAAFTGSPVVCFNLPLVTTLANFSATRIEHLEGGSWVDRTNLASINFATRTICTTALSSLSPFAIVQGAPTAAEVSLSGRVLTANGRGIVNAQVTLSGNSLMQRMTATTGPFGYYRFNNLTAGETFVVTVQSKRFTFRAPSSVISLADNLSGVNFVATQ